MCVYIYTDFLLCGHLIIITVWMPYIFYYPSLLSYMFTMARADGKNFWTPTREKKHVEKKGKHLTNPALFIHLP